MHKQDNKFPATQLNFVCIFLKKSVQFVCLDVLRIYGHVETVSSPNHTFFLGKLD